MSNSLTVDDNRIISHFWQFQNVPRSMKLFALVFPHCKFLWIMLRRFSGLHGQRLVTDCTYCNDFVFFNYSAADFAVFLAVIWLIDRHMSHRLRLKSLFWDSGLACVGLKLDLRFARNDLRLAPKDLTLESYVHLF